MSLYRLKQHILARLDKLEAAAKDPSKLIKQLSAIGLTSAEKAFKDQALGDFAWSERYPGMTPPVLNIAGAIKDFNAGRKQPKPNRFQDRPANVDEGTRGGLWGSLTITTSDDVVGWGSNKEYATLMQEGGVMDQDITEGAKERIQEYLYTGLFTEKAAESKRSIEKSREKSSVTRMEKKATIQVSRTDADWRAPTQKEIKKEIEWFQKKINKFGKERLKKRFTTTPKKYGKWKKRVGVGHERIDKLFARYGDSTNIQDAAYNKASAKKNKKRVSTFSSKVTKKKDAKGYSRKDLISKLKWAINPEVKGWSHGIGARPFLGITDETEVDMIKAVEDFFRKAQA